MSSSTAGARKEAGSSRPVIVFSDFDGTISIRDVGYHLFHHFSGGRNEQFIPAWKDGTMSSREVLVAEASLCELTDATFREYVLGHQLDQSLIPFLKRVESSGGEFIVLSDGLRPYIDLLLEANELHLPVIANDAHISGDSLSVVFPYHNQFCGYCGCCKRERIAERLPTLLAQNPDSLVLFIGDGMSDRCVVDPGWPVQSTKIDVKRLPNHLAEEDIARMSTRDVSTGLPPSLTIIPPVRVFAKKDLARFCERHDIPFFSYVTFADITAQLESEGIW